MARIVPESTAASAHPFPDLLPPLGHQISARRTHRQVDSRPGQDRSRRSGNQASIDVYREWRQSKPSEAKRLRTINAKRESQVERLIEAIESGGDGSERVKTRLAERRREICEHRQLLETRESTQAAEFDQAELRRQLKTNLDRFHKLLDIKEAPALRQVLS